MKQFINVPQPTTVSEFEARYPSLSYAFLDSETVWLPDELGGAWYHLPADWEQVIETGGQLDCRRVGG